MEHALPRRTAGIPRTWALCMTSENHGTVGKAGDPFSHAPGKHERVQVVEIVAADTPPAPDVDLAGLVRIDVADLIDKLGDVFTWARELSIPTRGAGSAMRKVREVREAIAAAPVAAQAGLVAAPLPAGPVRIADIPSIEITLRQAKELVATFGGHDAEISIFQRPAAWTDMDDGLYAFFSDYPDEGSMYLGPTEVDDDLAMNGEPLPAGDALDAARYRWMRDRMSFIAGQLIDTTMSLRAPIPAPDHDPHKDWGGERFDASVDRAIDAAMQAPTSGERQEGGA